MRLHLSRLHFPVTTLGPGRRVGIWLQGCSIRCPGCISADTWAAGLGETTVEAVLETLGPWLEEADGITISGGEPFEQPCALNALLRSLQAARPGADVLVYSGRPWEKISTLVHAWDGLLDAVISDPFDAGAGQTLAWRGSDNQRMHLLTARARERYDPWTKAPPAAMDLFFHGGEAWMAGIPAPGFLEAVQRELGRQGLSARTSADPRVLA